MKRGTSRVIARRKVVCLTEYVPIRCLMKASASGYRASPIIMRTTPRNARFCSLRSVFADTVMTPPLKAKVHESLASWSACRKLFCTILKKNYEIRWIICDNAVHSHVDKLFPALGVVDCPQDDFKS